VTALAACAGCGRGSFEVPTTTGTSAGPATDTAGPTSTGTTTTTTSTSTTSTSTSTTSSSTSSTSIADFDFWVGGCFDDVLNGFETDVDCGGPDCPPCETGKTCDDDTDCLSTACEGGVCACAEGSEQIGTALDDAVLGLAALDGGSLALVGRTDGALPDRTNAGGTDLFVGHDPPYLPATTVQIGTDTDEVAHAVAWYPNSAVVFVAAEADGAFMGPPYKGATDAVVFAVAPETGDVVWSEQFGTSFVDRAVDVAARPGGAVVAVGDLHDDLGDMQDVTRSAAFVAVFDLAGELQWNRLINSPEPDFGRAVALAPNGDILVVGDTLGQVADDPPAGNQDLFVARFPPNGPALWTRQFGTAFWDAAVDVAVDATGDLYLLAQSSGPLFGAGGAGGRDVIVAKLDASGDLLWAASLGTTSNDYGAALALHPGGGVVVAGHVIKALDGQTAFGGWDLFAARFDADGNTLWVRQAGTAEDDRATDVVATALDGIFLSATSTGPLGGPSFGQLDGAILHWCE